MVLRSLCHVGPCHPMDCSSQVSSVCGTSKARILDWVSISSSRRSSKQSAETTPGADCDSDQQLYIAKLRLRLRKVGETTRPFKHGLNQIPYDYTVEVMNRFKGLYLVDRVPEKLWTEVHNIVQEAVTKTISKKKKCRKAKSEEALQIAVERKEGKGKGEWEDGAQLNAEFQRIPRRDKKAFLNEQCKEIEESNRMGKSLQENWR